MGFGEVGVECGEVGVGDGGVVGVCIEDDIEMGRIELCGFGCVCGELMGGLKVGFEDEIDELVGVVLCGVFVVGN